MPNRIVTYKGFTLICRPRPLPTGRYFPRLVAARDNGSAYEEHDVSLRGGPCETEAEAASIALLRGLSWVDEHQQPTGSVTTQ